MLRSFCNLLVSGLSPDRHTERHVWGRHLLKDGVLVTFGLQGLASRMAVVLCHAEQIRKGI